MTSIRDVAKRAGVSVTTVSRVLTKSDHQVNEMTRQKVLDAVNELQFRPNALARALVSEHSKIVGVIVGDASDPYFATIIRGVSDIAREKGYLTIICNSDRDVDVELNYIRMLSDYRADGIIFAGGGLTNANYQRKMSDLMVELKEQRMAVVSLGCHLPSIPQVTIDNFNSTFDMTEYLIGLGHKKIAFISGPSGLITSSIRLEGFKKAMEKYQIPIDPSLIVESDFTYENGLELTEKFINLKSMPTAIFGSNDRVAIGALVKLKQHGIKIPEQVSVVGFDDISTTQQVDPALTTINVPMQQMGKEGMNQLLKILNGEEIETVRELPYKLEIRKSSGPIHE